MSDGKIYIVITDKLPQGGEQLNQSSSSNKEKDATSVLTKYAYHRFFNFVESQAKQAVNYTINNIGNFTGNYETQRDVQAAVKAANMLINIGMSAWAGAKVGAVGGAPGMAIGAVIGASIAIAGETINNAYEQNSLRVQQNKNNYAIEQLKQRSGLNSLIDGSRGTEN